VLPGDTEHDLHERIKPVERRLLIDVVQRIATGELALTS
jgi:phosphoribosylglycinamide formyltransferase-1